MTCVHEIGFNEKRRFRSIHSHFIAIKKEKNIINEPNGDKPNQNTCEKERKVPKNI